MKGYLDMKLKKLGMALVVVLALGAVMASSAFAKAETVSVNWKTGTTEAGVTTLVGSQAVTASATENGILETTVAEAPLTLKSTALSCVSCTITNSSGAKGSGQIKFENVTVVTPAACKVSGGSVTTKALAVDATYMEGTTNLIQFKPASGATFATVKLEGCSIAGSYNVTGVVYGKSANATKVYKTSQTVNFTPSINTTAGGELHFEAEEAKLTGGAAFAAGGKFFGTGE
jgi:hypothetical protein